MENNLKKKRWGRNRRKKKGLAVEAVEATNAGLSYGQYKWRQMDREKGARKSDAKRNA